MIFKVPAHPKYSVIFMTMGLEEDIRGESERAWSFKTRLRGIISVCTEVNKQDRARLFWVTEEAEDTG